MKRMYVVLISIFLLVFWAVNGFSQNQKKDPREVYEELHRRIMQNLMSGTPDDKVFDDMEKLMDDAMKDAGMGGGSSFSYSFGEQNFETAWEESSQGRTLFITPQSKEQKLDISVEKEMVTIKGKKNNSEFQNSFSIPQDCDSSRVKMDSKNGKIVMFFPWKTAKKIVPKKDERQPLPKQDSDVTI